MEIEQVAVGLCEAQNEWSPRPFAPVVMLLYNNVARLRQFVGAPAPRK
jgi:hypothetical protein